MKVDIGKYRNWFGPYQLAEKLCFWAERDVKNFQSRFPDWVHNFGELLAHGSIRPEDDTHWSDKDERPKTLLYKLLLWIDSKRKRKIKIRIDKWDTWNADHTLALIVLPMLKQLKATKHGYAMVDPEDAPKKYRWIEREEYDDQKDLFDVPRANTEPTMAELRWEWVMDEMIFAFEHLVDDDWESKFSSGNTDLKWVKVENMYDGQSCYRMENGPNHTYKIDTEGLRVVNERISNGLMLFGKYYRGLWD
jgi:hypothetical protein